LSEWLSTREVADVLRVSEASVRRWSDDGTLPVRRVGKRRERRFKRGDVEKFGEAARPARQPAPQTSPAVALGGEQVGVGTHLAAVYSSEAGRLRLTVPFLTDGLKLGQPCFLMAAGEVLGAYLEAFEHSLGVEGLDAARANGNLRIAPAPGATVRAAIDYWEDGLWSAVQAGARVVRVVGEMASEREVFVSEAEMLAYEAGLGQTIRRFPCVVVCQYDARVFSGEALLTALRAHPDLYRLPLGRFLN
jgi:excisionase family DNA binding protein